MLDRLGILGSVICAIHCTLPIFLGFFSPTLSSLFGNEMIHYALLIAVIPLAAFSFFKSRLIHKGNAPLLLGALGIAFLLMAIQFEEYFEGVIQNFELIMTVLGSLTLILSHFINLKLINNSRSGV